MPFEAVARSRGAEYIAAQRAHARSISSQTSATGEPSSPTAEASGQAETYNAQASPVLFMSPSPIYGYARRDEFPSYRARSTSQSSVNARGGGSKPNRSFSKVSAKGAATAPGPIPEHVNEEDNHATSPSAPTRSGSNSSASSRTIAAQEGSGADSNAEEAGDANQSNKNKDVEKGNSKKEKKSEQQGGSEPNRKSTAQREYDEKFRVKLEGRDHLNPHTWNETYRWFLTGLMGLFVLNATFASSGPSQLTPSIIAYFGVSQEVGVLTISLFVAGYCAGPLLWGPLSERFGRKLVFIIAFVPYTAFNVGAALSPNIGALLAFRFISGCFASSPLTNSGGVIADLWDADKRGIALAIFSLAPFAGPAIAPIVSGALQVTGSDWRWIFWILTMFSGVCLAIIVFVLPETYVPYLLKKEAKRLRKETGDDRWHSSDEHPDHKVTIMETLDHTVLKPFIMITQEPMLLVLTLYLAFVYGIVYLLFEAIPIIFQETHGWNALEGGLAFLGLPIGGLLAVIVYSLYFNKIYMRKHHALKGKMVPPEERLKPLMVAAPAFAIAFFWIGWTYYPSINPASPLLGIALMGFAILWQFLSVFNYLIDAYLASAASALAINTVVRSAFGAGFPLFATQMYNKLGVPGASSLLGGLAILFIPAPFVLYRYGKKIRQMSKHAMVLDE